ncbi:MAG: hypothetical protein AAGI01_04130 [Myxococcota bacterium]
MKAPNTSSALPSWAPLAAAAVALTLGLALSAQVWAQRSQLAEMQDALERVRLQAQAGAPRGASGAQGTEMTRRVRALEAEIGALRRRIVQAGGARSGAALDGSAGPESLLEGGPPTTRGDTGAIEPTPYEMQTVLAVLEAEDPEVRERLEGIFNAQRDRMREERFSRRRARFEERAKERFEGFSNAAQLSTQQAEALEPLLVEERDQVSDVFQSARDGEIDRRAAREQIGVIRSATDEEAKAVLDAEQQAEYDKMREEEVAEFMRRRRASPPPSAPAR